MAMKKHSFIIKKLFDSWRLLVLDASSHDSALQQQAASSQLQFGFQYITDIYVLSYICL